MEDKNNNGKFSYGFLLSVAAWILSSFVCGTVIALLNMNNMAGDQVFSNIAQGTLSIGILSIFIWIPLAIIAGNMSRKRGRKSVNMFILASFFISMLVVGGCFGSLNFG